MLLVNQKQLNTSNTDSKYELAAYAADYRKNLAQLREEYPDQKIRLQRTGWPKKSNGYERPVPPIILPAETMSNGEVWAYCKGRPTIEANGLATLKETSIMLEGLSLTLDLKKDADLAVYLMCKTTFVGKFFQIKDPIKEAKKRNEAALNELALKKTVYEGLSDENKCRIVATSWGVANATRDNIYIVRENLEKKVKEAQKKKDSDASNRSLRGIKEFIDDVKGDPEIRRRSVFQYAIDTKKMRFDKITGWYVIGDRNVLYVPAAEFDNALQYAANYFGHSLKSEEWDMFLKDVVDEELVNMQDKGGMFWLAKELGLNPGVKITAEEVKVQILNAINMTESKE